MLDATLIGADDSVLLNSFEADDHEKTRRLLSCLVESCRREGAVREESIWATLQRCLCNNGYEHLVTVLADYRARFADIHDLWTRGRGERN